MGRLTVRAGRPQDAAAHLRETVQVTMRDGDWYELLNALGSCGDLCAATGRPEEAVTAWAAWAALSRGARLIQPDDRVRRGTLARDQPRSRPGAGSGRRGTRSGVSLDIAAEYALMLTTPDPPTRLPAAAPDSSASGNGNWSSWSPRDLPTRRSPRSCTSASGPSARTWTGSGTRPAAAAALT